MGEGLRQPRSAVVRAYHERHAELLPAPSGLAVDAAGNLYVADSNARVREIFTYGTIATIAGSRHPRRSNKFTRACPIVPARCSA